MRVLLVPVVCVAIAACTSPMHPDSASLRPSAECEAANLKPPEPMQVGAIPASLLQQGKSGWVSVRYDVVAGKARNAVVVASEPPGLYDKYVLQHANTYAEPTGATVKGCLATTNIKF